MVKIITVLGARPQFVKAAVVSRAIAKKNVVSEVIIHTGQHFDEKMSDIFFTEMNIPTPAYNLGINSLDHGAMTGQMLEKIENVLKVEKPDLVLVYGDTNSTIAGALAAKKMHIKLAHVEAGLRSYNMRMPEEVNRIVTDRISDYLFCPTSTAEKNLEKEGFRNFDCKISNVGDVMYDAAMYYLPQMKTPNVDIPSGFILCTIHRSENTNDPVILENIVKGLSEIAKHTPIVLPLHPRTQQKLKMCKYKIDSNNLIMIDPVGYFEMIYLLQHSQLVVTDSGGLQKEAYFFKKHCMIIREETEWIELVDGGYNIICGSSPTKIINVYNKLLEMKDFDFDTQLYGDGYAGERIIDQLITYSNY
nr:UDP-N-acetylglucosamine 2-epimerase (non-hydrolyzing) [uncultured Sediminibacterium sp.]